MSRIVLGKQDISGRDLMRLSGLLDVDPHEILSAIEETRNTMRGNK
jgi:hypothetical protein